MDAVADGFVVGKFPPGFMWSTATSSYQVEGGWNEDGKSQSCWDVFSHTPGKVFNDDNGDVACDSYHKIEADVEALKKIGASHYRFSLSWPRILPEGTPTFVNQKGVDYYNKLIDALLRNKIQPVATLYHWDLPQCLEESGGWLAKDIVKQFVDFVDVCFDRFGDRVKWWITINEPSIICNLGYGVGIMAPGLKTPLHFSVDACHHVILAQVEAWHLYNDKYRNTQKGQVGLNTTCEWCEPYSDAPEDVEAAKRLLDLKLGHFLDPICGDGDYPKLLTLRFEVLKKLGIFPSDARMPAFTEAEKARNKGSMDFIGLNYYTSKLVRDAEDRQPAKNFEFVDVVSRTESLIDPSWKRGASVWLYSVPWGLRKLLHHLKHRYGDVPIFITENGFSDADGRLDDDDRIEYLKLHINAVLHAIVIHSVNVIGYTAWSFMDNFEWSRGYSEKFGMFRVDQKDPERKRVAKKSVEFYNKVIKDNGFANEA